MQHLLAKRNQRHFYILEYLMTHPHWTTLSTLATRLNCSNQSLSSDLKQINDLISPFEIETSQRYGIRLNIPSDDTVDFLYEKILADSVEFNLLELVFFDDSLDPDTLSEKSFLSASTLARTNTRLKRSLPDFTLNLTTTPAKITGEESRIRLFFMNYFLERYPHKVFPFPANQVAAVEKLIFHVFDEVGFNLSVFQFERLNLLSLVSLVRISQGYSVPVPTTIRSEISHVVDHIFEDEGLLVELNHAFELTFDQSILLEMLAPFLNPDILLSPADLYTPSPRIRQDKLSAITSFTEALTQKFNLPLSLPHELIFSLYNLDLFFVEHNYIFANRKKRFIDGITNSEPFYMAQLRHCVTHLAVYDYPIHSEELRIEILQLLITHWPHLMVALTKNMTKVTVGVFGEFDYQHSAFLTDLIQTRFSEDITVSVINTRSITHAIELSAAYDLVITNYPHLSWQSKQAILISAAPTAEDMNQLQILIHKLTAQINLEATPS